VFQVRWKDAADGTYTTLTLNPGPSTVRYPERRNFKARETKDGAVVINRPLADPRSRSWVWLNYPSRLVAYEQQWQKLMLLEYRARLEAGVYPIVEIWEDVHPDGGFERYQEDGTTKLWTPVKFVRVQRTLREDRSLVEWSESVIEIRIADPTWTLF
jgi:hypothetical protein